MAAAQPKIGQANDAGLDELLEHYGFKIGQDFVLDQQSAPGPIDMPAAARCWPTFRSSSRVEVADGTRTCR